MTALVCLLGCCAGVLLLTAGIGWSAFGSARSLYSPEQAKELVDAGAALHAATSGHSHDALGSTRVQAVDGPDHQAALAAARARFEEAEAALATARFAQDQLGAWLMGLGLAATVAFGIGYALSRGD